jgi:TolB-like protein
MQTLSRACTWSEAQSEAIRTELDRIVGSPLFAQAKRQRRFLQFIVTETLAGRADRISGYSIGIGVYDRDRAFEPMLDPIVRVEAGRLRAKLREYYEGDGQADPIRIGLDKGSYAATIHLGRPGNYRPTLSASKAEKPSLVVLPFVSVDSSPKRKSFADGVTEDLITDLSKLRNLLVVSHQVSCLFIGTHKAPLTIARNLGVHYLLGGSIRYAGGCVRVNAQLVDGVSGQALWAARYDRKLTDDFAVQDEVTRNIVQAIRLRVFRLWRRVQPRATSEVRPRESSRKCA